MKLRNKKTGEILELPRDYMELKGRRIYYSLAELNEEWEDYEEPKTAWFIEPQGDIQEWRDAECDDWTKEKSIGNYFKTREEAEKAVEKLKAWKRLKDNGVKFNLDFVENNINFIYKVDGTLRSSAEEIRIIFNDLKLLFGDEE